MKIDEINVKEFKALKDFHASPNGKSFLLFGENGLGKSSVMQFIQIALGNQKHIPQDATGEGHIVMDKDGQKYRFDVVFKNGKPNIMVTAPDGLKDSRKGTIAGIVGAIDFDINEFVELSKSDAGRKKQVEIFKSYLDKETKNTLARLEENVRINEESRLYEGRKLKEVTGAIAQNPLVNEVNPVPQPPDGNSIVDQINAAQSLNGTIDNVVNGKITREKDKEDTDNQIEILKAKSERLAKEISDADAWLLKNKKVDIEPLKTTLKSISDLQQRYSEWQKLVDLRAEADKLKMSYGELDALIQASKESIRDCIRDMDSPVEGLYYDNDRLIYKGIPVTEDNLSTSEIIELGAKLKIAENKDFGVLFIDNAESIGEVRLNNLLEIAERGNLQVIMAEVKRGLMQLSVNILSK